MFFQNIFHYIIYIHKKPYIELRRNIYCSIYFRIMYNNEENDKNWKKAF